MTLDAVPGSGGSSAGSFCSCCGAKMVPYFSEDAVVSKNQINQLISESFLTVKGAALFLPRGNSPPPNSAPRISQRRNKHTGDLQKHLQTMFTVLRPEDTIRLAVRLESSYPQVTRYMVVISTNGRQDTEESIVLGMDFVSSDSCCTVGLVLPLWSDTLIHLDGDGGFSVSSVNRVHVFKPVSVQAMWSALQSLHKACDVARCHNHYPGSLFLTWVSYYQSRISSNQFCINEWNAMQDVESHRADSPILFTDLPTERERTERLIKMRLREIMMQKDLENVTSKEIRTELEMQMVCNLREFKEFIDNEMIVILGQMDSPTEIFEHVYLGSEWNASNLEELQNSGVGYILNVTREIDNFFPGMFEYHNIRVYDEEATNLLEYWNETYKFITKAKKAGAKCLVHCKMGVSRSASTVIAYAMKEYGWDLDTAFDYVKERRAVTKPNPSFMKQLEEYQGILLASKQRHNKLWRSHSDSDLSDRPDPLCKPSSHPLGRSNSHNNNNNAVSSPSLHHFLGVAVLQALGAEPEDPTADSASDSNNGTCDSPVGEGLILPPLPRPSAATVVSGEQADNSASVAVAVPAAVPHPPPSLHILPPTPELQRARRGRTPSRPPAAVHPCLPERGSSGEASPVSLGSPDSDTLEQSLSDLPSDKLSPLSPAPTPSPPPSDANNNPGEALDGRGEADGSSNHSADSIDFFTAREKFLGLAQDGRTRTLSEPVQHRSASLDLEENGDSEEKEDEEEEEEKEEERGTGMNQSEDGVFKASPDRPHPHDNGISVRHIVTEIEAISHPAPCLAATSPCASSSSSSSLPLSPQPVRPERREEAEVAHGSLTPPSLPQSPSMLPCDWPAGSVRRATEQLEQKLRQEMETAQRSPLHSPSNESPPARTSPCSPGAEHPPLRSLEQTITQGETAAVSAKSKDTETLTGSQIELQRLNSSGTDDLPDPPCPLAPVISRHSGATAVSLHTSTDSHMLTTPQAASPVVESCLDTSAHAQRQSRFHGPNQHRRTPPLAARDQIPLDGATVQESETDGRPDSGCGPGCDARSRLARGSQELERIQQSLQELQAFLHEGAGLEAGQPRDAMDTESGPCKGAGSEQNPAGLGERQEGRGSPEPAAWHRAVELEARIRQAGLTPPSLMKRSASLAKLDCLELSANDLSDLDLTSHTRPTAARPQGSTPADDTWKKQKVLARNPARTRSSPSPPSPRLSPAPRRSPKEEAGGEREESDGGRGGASRQQGRGHSSRRSRKAAAVEKKQRVATVLYNTM